MDTTEGQIARVTCFQESLADGIEHLAQNHRLTESAFICFCRDRGLPVFGIGTGDPGKFYSLGLLKCDSRDESGNLLFHPFRSYTAFRILKACRLPIAPSASLSLQSIHELVESSIKIMPDQQKLRAATKEWDLIADLAIMLEPVYWLSVVGQTSYYGYLDEERADQERIEYHQKLTELIRTLDSDYWKKAHELLRIEAAKLDDNHALYLLLRLAKWDQRNRLKGDISMALWIRHIAEVIRRAFHDVKCEEWDEEDQAFGFWQPGARKIAYGSDRPLDNVLESIPKLVHYFGLFSGSTVRWYVEGETEYYAILETIPDPAISGIELLNLRGNIVSGKGNIAMKLSDALDQDLALQRFSMVTIDRDVSANVKAIRRYILERKIVGLVAAHDPDFEFANFTLKELVEIASKLDENNSHPSLKTDIDAWLDISNGKLFEERYVRLTKSGNRSLKGEAWGRALARYAQEKPNISIDRVRPFIDQVGAALRARHSHYDYTREHWTFDPETFQTVEIKGYTSETYS